MHWFPYHPSPSSPTNLSPQSLLTLEAQSRSSYLIKKPRLLGWRGDGIGWEGALDDEECGEFSHVKGGEVRLRWWGGGREREGS